jgi:hypothetical protein
MMPTRTRLTVVLCGLRVPFLPSQRSPNPSPYAVARRQRFCSVDKVLTYMACPYFARKILKHAARFVKDIVISVEGANNGASVILVYTLQLFGTTITTLKLGESVTVKNLWNKDVVCNTKIHDDSLRMQFSKHPGVPEGTVTDDKWFFLNGDTNTLVWEATCKRPDMEPLVNLQYFVREADAKAAGRRASMV